jgi:indolepyruvate ferredoxin oxidoreductase
MDERFLKEEGAEVFTGNELILKGALESECALITGYPGSPVSDIFDAAHANRDLLRKHGILAHMANNEALAVARLNGSRMAGVRAMAVMKSVGMHVAADGLALGNLSEPQNAGGSLVVVGDDPWIDSTQINNDSRYLSQHLHMPVLEPATFQEMKDWVGEAFELSSAANLYITYLITTNQADGGGTVWVHPNRYPGVSTDHPVEIHTERINLDTNVLLPPRTWAREASLPQRFVKLLAEARRRQMNKLLLPTEVSGEGGDEGKDRALTLALSHPPDGRGKAWQIGFISAGLPYCYLEHALTELGLGGKFPILKLGLTYPLDPEAVLALARQVQTILVIEEKRGFIEQQVVQILHEARQSGDASPELRRPLPDGRGIPPFDPPLPVGEGWGEAEAKVWGKKFPYGLPGIPEGRGLNASVVMERLIPLFLRADSGLSDSQRARLRKEQVILEATARFDLKLPARTPTFCPGCPHRDSADVLLQVKKDFMSPAYMQRTHRRKPVDLVFHGETGCFTMLMFEPNKPLMHNYSGMGLGGGTGAGADPFITNKQVVFLGDSTFFHSGMISISDSLKAGQDITYIILDNKTTAMTGHQPTPGTEWNLMGDKTLAQNIEAIVAAMAGRGRPVHRVNPNDRGGYRELLEKTILSDGVKIIIADKECGLTSERRLQKEKKRLIRRDGFLAEERQINVTPEVCEFCLECTQITGCPGLAVEDTVYGPKIVTDLTHCVSDGACARLKACPSFEEVMVKRRVAPKEIPSPPVGEGVDGGENAFSIPPPLPSPTRGEESLKDPFCIYTAGVGGQGAGVVTAVLVTAAHLEGYRSLFTDKKGLAVRNGGVYGHLLLSRSGGVLSPLVPYGKADLLLGIDPLEAARAADPKARMQVVHPEKTSAVVNTTLNSTILMLMGQDQAFPSEWEEALRSVVKPGGFWGEDLSAISERWLGSKLYCNMMLLGAAFQKGLLPLSLESLEKAMARVVSPEDRRINLSAFRAGRALVFRPELFRVAKPSRSFRALFDEKTKILETQQGWRTAKAYRCLVEETVLGLDHDEALLRELALRVYGLIQYEGVELAQRYVDLILTVRSRDRREWGWAATRAVVLYAFKVLAIKDEIYVAHLLTSVEKLARDRERFKIDKSRGDRIHYRHLTRPEFTIFGRSFRWDMVTRNWQLQIMKRLKVLRRLWPGWHRAEREFRDWYLALARLFEANREESYQLWVHILSCPENVRGYREIRFSKMKEAQRSVMHLLMSLRGGPQTSGARRGNPSRPRAEIATAPQTAGGPRDDDFEKPVR